METLVELVRQSGRRFDRRPALLIRPSFRTRVLRYRDLAAVVPRVARVLSDAGLRPDDKALIWAVNRPEWGVAFLGVAWLGAVSVPVDVRHPIEFGRKVTDQTSPTLVIASRQTEAAVRQLGLPIIWLETLLDQARRAEPMEPAPVTGESLMEIVYTSGTTGEPKGAMLSHGNVMACTTAMSQVLPVGPTDRFLSVLPLSHMYEQVLGFIGLLLVGASIVYPVSRQPAVLVRTFRDYKVTGLLIVPQGLRLLDAAIQRKVDASGKRSQFELLHRLAARSPRWAKRLIFRPVLSEFGGKLRLIGSGASALDEEVARRWMNMGIEILQGYGATEMGPVVTFTRPGPRNVLETVGEPIPGIEVRIAADGEILARGPGRFLGYWQNPEATAAAIDAEGWYHTGDLGKFRPDGLLTFRGRKKDMIALPDGQKVYAEDVEAVLRTDPRVRDAAVVGWPAGPALRVHAVLLLDDPDLEPEVVAAANQALAAHQQVRGSTVWPDDDLPRTHTLKIRKVEVIARLDDLERPEPERGGGRTPGVTLAALRERTGTGQERPPVDPVVAIVASITSREIGDLPLTARLSTDLELDSLGRVELLGVIEEELGVFVNDDALEPDASVADLVALVEANRGVKPGGWSWGWALSPAARAVGLGFQLALMGPFVKLFYAVRTTGLERLDALEGPLMLTPNHCLHLDNAILLSRLPLGVRWRLSIAAAADTIYRNPVQGALASLLANAFPLQREGGVRRSLEMLGSRLDRGFNILIYPEGKLTVGGPLQPFKAGAGLVAVDGGTPVVPVRFHIRRMSIIDRRRFPAPLRGEVEVVIGEPIWFDADTDHATATTMLEEAVARL